MNKMYVLAFDTANEVIAIGVGIMNPESRSIALVASSEVAARRASNTQLLPRIDAVLAEHEIRREDIACVAVGRGPGSFTGVRIAMATAKGSASALGVGLIGVSSLDAVAWNVQAAGGRGPLVVVADAMRKEVYPVRYALDEEGVERLDSDRVVKAEDAGCFWRCKRPGAWARSIRSTRSAMTRRLRYPCTPACRTRRRTSAFAWRRTIRRIS